MLSTVGLSAVLVVAVAGPAAASRAPPAEVHDAIKQADVVVVGTVTATRSHDRIATIAVEEVWKGDVGATLEVFGGPDRDDAATSVDRTYESGVRYLIVAFEPAAHDSGGTFGGRYEDNACSATQPWSDALSTLRPSSARMLTPSTSTPPTTPRVPADQPSDSQPALTAGVAAAVLAGAGLSFGMWWRRRR